MKIALVAAAAPNFLRASFSTRCGFVRCCVVCWLFGPELFAFGAARAARYDFEICIRVYIA